jgi:hypothetical protein
MGKELDRLRESLSSYSQATPSSATSPLNTAMSSPALQPTPLTLQKGLGVTCEATNGAELPLIPMKAPTPEPTRPLPPARVASDQWGSWGSDSGNVALPRALAGQEELATRVAVARMAVPKRLRNARAACVRIQRAWRNGRPVDVAQDRCSLRINGDSQQTKVASVLSGAATDAAAEQMTVISHAKGPRPLLPQKAPMHLRPDITPQTTSVAQPLPPRPTARSLLRPPPGGWPQPTGPPPSKLKLCGGALSTGPGPKPSPSLRPQEPPPLPPLVRAMLENPSLPAPDSLCADRLRPEITSLAATPRTERPLAPLQLSSPELLRRAKQRLTGNSNPPKLDQGREAIMLSGAMGEESEDEVALGLVYFVHARLSGKRLLRAWVCWKAGLLLPAVSHAAE